MMMTAMPIIVMRASYPFQMGGLKVAHLGSNAHA
jgi:hypothetical protein